MQTMVIQKLTTYRRGALINGRTINLLGLRDLIKFRNLPLFWKISFIPILAVSLVMIGVFFYVLPLTKEKLTDDKRTNSSDVVSVAYTMVAEYDRRVATGEFTLDEAQNRAKERIRNLRFGKDGKGYIWINNLEAKMLMHPLKPDLEGKDISDFKDQNGRQFFKEMIKVCKENGEGFVHYVGRRLRERSLLLKYPTLSSISLGAG